MIERPYFTIIVPIYNAKKELTRCVDSILSQNYNNYEIILVDDGSTDGTDQLCDNISAKDSRIICIHKVNGGVAEARNVGIRAAKGKFIMFVDSDDMWRDSDALQNIYGILGTEPIVDVLCFGMETLKEDETLINDRIPYISDKIIRTKENILKELIYQNQYISAAYVKVVNRQFLLENDLFFKIGYTSGEDIDWSGRVMVLAQEIGVYSCSFYKYIRRTSGSITSNQTEQNVIDVLDEINWGINFVNQKSEGCHLKDIYYEYWAYQYAMLFVMIGNVPKGQYHAEIMSRMKKYTWLLKYNHVKKVHAVQILHTLFGMKISLAMLAIYYRWKKK